MNSYIAFDLETTGLSPTQNEILEIGAWKIKNNVVVSKFSQLVKPVGYIPRDVQMITHITQEMVESELSIEEVIPSFFDFCEDLPMLGYNIQFDYRFICDKGTKCGYDFSLNKTRCGIDVYKLVSQYLKTVPSKKLEDIVKYFKIDVTNKDSSFHRAWYDAYMTKLIYDRFLYFYHDLSGVLLPEILDVKDTKVYGKVECDDTLSFK